ncbi:hypothetical protein GE107_10000 [Cohnella sp. CFH 77786]|uniref:hypothetical protein n=1 Tax=Cohnella sp. CFH 77786 TaxID=2662265 RepID=UPI001C60C58D|nr:hypothetical protein [Cohnella sp. CFH 77786]MBW5446392.1 hypothetical protein [Cohnella sp. CFH 77786]
MKPIRIPAFLHEVFGQEQRMGIIGVILLFGGLMTGGLYFRFPEMADGIALWRSILAFLLIFDICSGCIANFTRATSDYYARYPRKRIVFIAIHVHLVLVALLLGTNVWQSLLVWAFTIAGAYSVNAVRGSHQLFVAGVLLSAGIGWIPMLPDVEPYMVIIGILFMLKVLLSFSVDHYGKAYGKLPNEAYFPYNE